jgi:hypothetical protein
LLFNMAERYETTHLYERYGRRKCALFEVNLDNILRHYNQRVLKNPKILERTQRVVNRCLPSNYLCARLRDFINAPKVDLFPYLFAKIIG